MPPTGPGVAEHLANVCRSPGDSAQDCRDVLPHRGRVVHAREYCYQVKLSGDSQLYGYCALMKVQATRSLEFCARRRRRPGGSSYTRSGGARIEAIYREVRVLAIGGGSEEAVDLAKGARL